MQPAQSQENGKLKIAAIVNDKVISILDLNKRLHLITVLSPAQIKGEIDKQLARQILNQLIGEELEKQEIERLKIKIGEKIVNIIMLNILSNKLVIKKLIFLSIRFK